MKHLGSLFYNARFLKNTTFFNLMIYFSPNIGNEYGVFFKVNLVSKDLNLRFGYDCIDMAPQATKGKIDKLNSKLKTCALKDIVFLKSENKQST